MFRLFGCLCLTIFLTSCTFSSREWQQLQRDFLDRYPHADAFLVPTEHDTLKLPLPPDPAKAEHWPVHAEALRRRAYALDSTRLTESEKAQWKQLKAALDAESRRTNAGNDTLPYLLDDLLRHFVGRDQVVRHPALLTALVEQMPAYYAQVQQRLQTPDPWADTTHFERAAAMVEQLQQLENNLPHYSIGYRERLQRALPKARAALKDYFGWRQSGAVM